MSGRQRFRTMVVAVSGGVILALGSGGALADNQFPLGDGQAPPGQQQPQAPQDKRLEKAPEKAEKLGNNALSKTMDLGANLFKCALNIVTPSMKCEL
ncbi:hypothetical protein [Nocardia aurantia]|uniref:Uncharacterized protein n=1 Tax=Nocardia aurantia TaxID=2585199 RepID=A0A7K0DRN5_9NOCA|nr:hypothetical protein [Nocardia aurantia]MQY28268.1 hypothetical protein [Nocardia aurantia]